MAKLTIGELSEKLGLSRQCVSFVVKNDRVKSLRIGKRKYIDEADWLEYEKSRWKRDAHYKSDEISIIRAAAIMGISVQRLYYLVRRKIIPSQKRGGMIFLKRENV